MVAGHVTGHRVHRDRFRAIVRGHELERPDQMAFHGFELRRAHARARIFSQGDVLGFVLRDLRVTLRVKGTFGAQRSERRAARA